MSPQQRSDEDTLDRRAGDLVVVAACIVALSLLAMALGGAGAPLPIDAGDDPSAEGDGDRDRAALVGGGSLGNADRNPIGAGIGEESNPFQDRSTDVQFRVETDTPGYWRVDAYDAYGDGEWRRTGTASEHSGVIDAQGPATELLSHTVTLERDAASLPVVWQPARITDNDEPPMTLSPETGVGMPSPKPADSTYTIESYCYAPDEDLLETAGTEYPRAIEERYTSLPDDVPDRVHDLGDELTADADSAPAATELIGVWLDEHATYSREETPDSTDDPVDSFLFEERTGTAEYYASSAVILLRSQDIPARYVTGYAPGEAIDGETYVVRAIHAHAWVEFYVPGHGWIPFDPTPAADRLATENAFVDTEGEMVDVPIAGDCSHSPDDESSNDTGGENGVDPPDNDENDDIILPDPPDIDTNGEGNDIDEELPPGINISLSDPSPTPGQDLTITVTRDDDPVEDATVRFNGESIGDTNANGEATGTVPFANPLEVSVELETDTTAESMPPVVHGGSDDTLGTGHGPGLSGVQPNVENASVTVPITAEINVVAESEPLVIGGTATVQAFIGDTVLTEADVVVANESVGTTDANGELSFTVPEDLEEGPTAITVSRGDITTEHTVTVGSLSLTPASETVLALPGDEVTVTATVGDEPREGVTLSRDNEVVGTTDANGTATVPVSVTPTTAIEGTVADYSVTAGIHNLLLPVGVGTIVTAALMGGVRVALGRRTDATGHIRSWSARIRQVIVTHLLAVIDTVEGRLVAIRDRLAGDSLGAVGRSFLKALAGGTLRRVGRLGPRKLLTTLRSIARRVYGLVSAAFASDSGGSNSPSSIERSDARGADRSGSISSTRRAIRGAWATFVRLVARRVSATTTPGEIRQRAIDLGLPPGPVRRLTSAFRAAEYGPESALPAAAEATDALATIEAEGDENEPIEQDGASADRKRDPPSTGD